MATTFPSMAQRRKTYPAFGTPGAGGMPTGSMSVPLPPLPAMGTSEPTSPMATAQVPPLPTAGRGFVSGVTGGDPSTALQRFTPLGGGVGGVPARAWEGLGSLEQAEGMMRASPEALRYLDPYFAANLERKETEAAQERAQQRQLGAIETMAPTAALTEAAAPPDIKGLLGAPGLSESYWENLRTATLGETRARFDDERDYYEEQARRGAIPRAYAQRMMAEVGERQRGEELKGISALERERAQLTEAAKQQHANLYLALQRQTAPDVLQRQAAQAGMMERFPDQPVAWTGIEDYLRKYQEAQMAKLLGLGARAGGGGGGVAGKVFGPVGGDTSGFGGFGGGVVEAPRAPGQYLGGAPLPPAPPVAPAGMRTTTAPGGIPNVTGFSPVPPGGYEFLGDYEQPWF